MPRAIWVSLLLVGCGIERAPGPAPDLSAAALVPPLDSAGNYRDSILVGGRWRAFLVHTPAGAVPEVYVPLLLAFHGGGGTSDNVRTMTHLDAVADHRGFLVVFPQAVGSWVDGGGDTPPPDQVVDDVAFVAALLDTLAARHRILPDRVFATGISSGGFFTERLACDLSGRIAAVASVAATMSDSVFLRCNPPRAVPFALIHGTDDHWVPYAGGAVRLVANYVAMSADSAIAFWVRHNACTGVTQVVYEPNRAVFDGTLVRRETTGACRDNATVVLYAVEGGGHTWPGGTIDPILAWLLDLGLTSRDIDAGETMWDFFSQHPMPGGGGSGGGGGGHRR